MFPTRDAVTNRIKYVAPSRAIVLDIADPDALGRVRVDSPILGETNWIPYLQLPGTFTMPSVGDVVYIQCDGGFETHPVAFGNLILNKGEDENQANYLRKNPTVRGFYTPGGHLIEIDDGKGLQAELKGIRITTSDGSKIHISEYTDNKKIILERNEGSKIEIDGQADKIFITTANTDTVEISKDNGIKAITKDTILEMKEDTVKLTGKGSSLEIKDASIIATDSNGNTVTLDSSGSKIQDSNSNKIEMTSSGIKATDSAGAGLNISSGKVALGGAAAEVVDILVQFLQELSTDSFPGFGSPAGKAAIYAQLAAKLSTIKGTL